MNKTISVYKIVVLICVIVLLGVGAEANVKKNNTKEMILIKQENGFILEVFGEAYTIVDDFGRLVHPITVNGETFLPAKTIASLTSSKYSWNQNKHTISMTKTKNDTQNILNNVNDASKNLNYTQSTNKWGSIDKNLKLYINGKRFTKTLDKKNLSKTGILTVNGVVFLPLAIVKDVYGYQISWDEFNQKISINKQSEELTAQTTAIRSSSTSAGVSAQETNKDYEYKKIKDKDNEIIIIRYVGNDSIINIPDSFDGLVVKEIGCDAFANHSNLISVTIPATVVMIHDTAFVNCKSLKAAYFEGDAPILSLDWGGVFDQANSDFTVYCHANSKYFKYPKWNDYPVSYY